MQQQETTPQSAAQRVEQINQAIDTLLKNVDNMTPLLIAREERYGYGDRRVAEGWQLTCGWLEEVERLEEERRQLRQQPTARAS